MPNNQILRQQLQRAYYSVRKLLTILDNEKVNEDWQDTVEEMCEDLFDLDIDLQDEYYEKPAIEGSDGIKKSRIYIDESDDKK